MPKKQQTVDDDREPIENPVSGETTDATLPTSTDSGKSPEIADNVDRPPVLLPIANGEGVSVGDAFNKALINTELEYGFVKAADFDTLPLELQHLIESGITTHDSSVVIWRTGHLEHVARLYAGDPVQTERDYHDDVMVAKAYSADEWARLVEVAKS